MTVGEHLEFSFKEYLFRFDVDGLIIFTEIRKLTKPKGTNRKKVSALLFRKFNFCTICVEVKFRLLCKLRTQAVQSTSRPTPIPSGTRSNETTRLRSRQSSKTLTKPLSKWMSLKKCKSFASSASAKPSRIAQAPFPVWCTVPIAARSCTTELPTMASERECSSIVRFIGSTRTSAEHTLSVNPFWNEWC